MPGCPVKGGGLEPEGDTDTLKFIQQANDEPWVWGSRLWPQRTASCLEVKTLVRELPP